MPAARSALGPDAQYGKAINYLSVYHTVIDLTARRLGALVRQDREGVILSGRQAQARASGDGRPTREPPPDPATVFRAMNQASKRLPHYFDKNFGIPDLRLTEFGILQQLAESGPTPMARLSDENLVTKAAITVIIDEMESKGLVRRDRDSSDRRIVNIQLTPGGRKLFATARRRYEEVVAGLVSLLEPDELRALVRSFEKLNRYVEEHSY